MATPWEHLALRLLKIGAVQFGSFRLKLHETNPEAPLSPIYFNLRSDKNPNIGPLEERDYRFIVSCMGVVAASYDLTFDTVAGIPNAGDPMAAAFVQSCAPSKMLINLEKTTIGDQRRISGVADGHVVRSRRILLVDDLITKADSKLEAIQCLRRRGGIVKDVLVLIDREQGGAAELAEAGCNLHSVFKMSELLSIYAKWGEISTSQLQTVRDYLAAC